ncbi:MAG: CHAT domain-containing protein [Pyrinomonadaceae bacterium]
MLNEREFIAQVELADVDELARLLEHPTTAQERALRAHLGDERYQRMHGLALKRSTTRSMTRDANRPNVVVIHGIMGAELSVSGINGGSGDLTWVSYWRIMRGWLDRLRLTPDGRGEANDNFRVRASGTMKRYYGELMLSLAQRNNVKDFFFDWRKDLNIAADALNSKINEWFGNEPVHIVAHSMGGLAARTFISNYSARWQKMWDSDNGTRGGRLIMLGTPNHGSYTIPTVMTGLEGMVRKLAALDLRHDTGELLETLNTFVGTYQMLPSPRVAPEATALYDVATYSPFKVNVSQEHLDGARSFHDKLAGVADSQRMIYVAGSNRPTLSGVKDWRKLDKLEGYDITREGDGRVPHRLGKLEGVKMYYIEEDHGALSTNTTIMRALDDLLSTGETRLLSDTLPAIRAVQPRDERAVRDEMETNLKKELGEITDSLSRMRMRTVRRATRAGEPIVESADGETVPDERYGPEQRRLEENVMRGFLGGEPGTASRGFEVEPFKGYGKRAVATIEIGLVLGGIEEVHKVRMRSGNGNANPVDVIAVGHYIGVRPQAAEESLDVSISTALFKWGTNERNKDRRSELLLTQYTDRGIVHGKLGEPFFLPDPRDRGGKDFSGERIIAIAGMGEPANFGASELTVLARELCWSLGRLKKQHLATVLIGSGNGNMAVREAVASWIEGVRRALTGSIFDEGWRLDRITFVENDPRKIREIENALKAETKWQAAATDSAEQAGNRKNDGARTERMVINYVPLSKAEMDEVQSKIEERERARWQRAKTPDDGTKKRAAAPTRVNLSLDVPKKTYRFGAITDIASVPERDIRVDPKLIMQANDEMVGERASAMQLERGRFLEGLLMPNDLRRHLYTNAPLVLMLDATTARIHWEMVAQPEITIAPGMTATDDANEVDEEIYKKGFLGTTRGLTRQLRTTFAPPPEPPPPPRRVLRVLVVADPAADAHLPGAQEEGVEVADLFESYNLAYQDDPERSQIQVKRMFGPLEATRTNVLRELMSRPYDVLHYAGHCVFQWDGDPDASGWIFNAKERELLSAYELNRIDRVPKFVFSNACESGITPDRSEERSAGLAPSFAEAFFNRGVSNFVCTAWPVDDLGAREFALTLYARLLGLSAVADQPGRYERDIEGSQPMHLAMRDARRKVAVTPNGRTTWGAYQHYGSPYFQLFYPPKKEDNDKPMPATPRSRAGKAVATADKKRPRKRPKNRK